MFCKVCGLNIEDSLKTCPNCGAAVINTPYAPPVSQMPQPPSSANTNDGIAVAALVLGIVSAALSIICCVPYVTAGLGFVCGIVGLILGFFTLKTKKRTQAIIGISLSALALIVSIIVVIGWTVFIVNADKMDTETEDGPAYEYSQFNGN